MKRLGTVLTFRPGTTKAQADAALAKIADVLDIQTGDYRRRFPDGALDGNSWTLDTKPRVHEYDDAYGGPVWYIP